jgi:hypothetical protein
MQPYFDPTRKTTSKKNGRLPQQKITKMEDDLKKNENGRQPQIFFKARMTTSKEMEDDLKFVLKMEDDQKKMNGRRPKKMEEEPINQNQPNWL